MSSGRNQFKANIYVGRGEYTEIWIWRGTFEDSGGRIYPRISILDPRALRDARYRPGHDDVSWISNVRRASKRERTSISETFPAPSRAATAQTNNASRPVSRALNDARGKALKKMKSNLEEARESSKPFDPLTILVGRHLSLSLSFPTLSFHFLFPRFERRTTDPARSGVRTYLQLESDTTSHHGY